MDSETQVALSCALSFGAPLALAVRELIALRRGGGDGWGWHRPRVRRPDPPPGPAGHRAPAQKPLPDCLIPRPVPGPAVPRAADPPRRVLEPA